MTRYAVADIMALHPCYSRTYVDSLWGDREGLTLAEICDLPICAEDRIWAILRLAPVRAGILWAADCAESVLHLVRIEDRDICAAAIAAARNPDITPCAAWAAARAARAARAAAWAARAAAWAARAAAWAARDAAGDTRAAAWDAAWAARAAAWAARDAAGAARAAAWAAARAARAAWDAAWAAAWDRQLSRLVEIAGGAS